MCDLTLGINGLGWFIIIISGMFAISEIGGLIIKKGKDDAE